MLRERSPSPPTVQSKRQTPSPRLALSTRYSPDEMNNSPNFEEKKKFLTIFNLTHISAEKRKGMACCGPHRVGPLCGHELLEKQAQGSWWDLKPLRPGAVSAPSGPQGGGRFALTGLPRCLSGIDFHSTPNTNPPPWSTFLLSHQWPLFSL